MYGTKTYGSWKMAKFNPPPTQSNTVSWFIRLLSVFYSWFRRR